MHYMARLLRAAGPRRLAALALRQMRRLGRAQGHLTSGYHPAAEGQGRDALTSTMFYRNYPQMALLFEVLIPDLERAKGGRKLRIASIGCSLGCEPFSLAIEAMRRGVADGLEIMGFDVDRECIEAARKGVFSAGHFEDSVARGNRVPAEVLATFFQEESLNGVPRFRLRPDIVQSVKFAVLDILKPVAQAQSPGGFDVILFQNALLHFSPQAASRALRNLVRLADAPAYLLVGGADLDWLERSYRRARLVPVLERAQAIHEAWLGRRKLFEQGDRGYIALEPFGFKSGADPARYCSVFKLEGASRGRA